MAILRFTSADSFRIALNLQQSSTLKVEYLDRHYTYALEVGAGEHDLNFLSVLAFFLASIDL